MAKITTKFQKIQTIIGAGIWYYPKWENVDYYTNKFYVDYKIDLRTKQEIPLASNSTKIIFSSHFFEHISIGINRQV